MKKIFSIFVAFLIVIESALIFISIFVDFGTETEPPEINFLEGDQSWSDTLLNHMTLEEKIGQILMIELDRVNSDSVAVVDSLFKTYNLGGVKFKNSTLLNQALVTNRLQALSKYPILIGSEGSVGNQDDFHFPFGPIINSSCDSVFIDQYLENFAELLKFENIHIDFSNSFDLGDTTLPSNCTENEKIKLKKQALIFRKKLHNNHIISCLKIDDSLFCRNDIKKTDSTIALNLKMGLDKFFAIMQSPKATSSIIYNKTIRNYVDFLKQDYGFKGLLISGLTESVNDTAIIKLFKSGTDLFLIKENFEKPVLEFTKIFRQNKISISELNFRVKRVLMAKKWAGLDKREFQSAEQSISRIYSQNRLKFAWKLYEKSVCLIKNQANTLPFIQLLNNQAILVTVGNNDFKILDQYLNYYLNIGSIPFTARDNFQKKISGYRNVIVAINKPLDEIADSVLFKTLKQLSVNRKVIVVNFANPANIRKLLFAGALLQAYDEHPYSQMITAQVIAGSIAPTGTLIPTIDGLPGKQSFLAMERLQYTIPETAGFSSVRLRKLDSLLTEAIKIRATPGCQVLVAKNGKVFYYKSFGRHEYGYSTKVENSHIYDLASITKVAATTMAAMKLYEGGKIRLTDSIKYYIADTINCTIKNHQLRDFFMHKTGLQPDMPVLQYINYRKPGTSRYEKYYSNKKDSLYTLKVADDFYLRKDYRDSIVFSLYNLEWDTAKPYQYSDINFNIIYDIILRRINDDYVKYLKTNIYEPLQLRTIGFMPIEKFPEQMIAPTQEDKYWRKELLVGIPHDESAALYGGISGNAGLFSNANDLAILFQMLLNGGNYGGKKIFKKETVDYFTSIQENTTRGLGFALNDGFYGHTGFTGCAVWANPRTQMIFVFLSNSIHPKPTNQKLKRLKYRSRALNLVLSAYGEEKLNEIGEE